MFNSFMVIIQKSLFEIYYFWSKGVNIYKSFLESHLIMRCFYIDLLKMIKESHELYKLTSVNLGRSDKRYGTHAKGPPWTNAHAILWRDSVLFHILYLSSRFSSFKGRNARNLLNTRGMSLLIYPQYDSLNYPSPNESSLFKRLTDGRKALSIKIILLANI